MAQRRRGTKAQRHKGTEAQRHPDVKKRIGINSGTEDNKNIRQAREIPQGIKC
jgi:hypothetical protein